MTAQSRPAEGSRIVALGHYLPPTVRTTEEIVTNLGVDAEWAVSRTGIRERRLADKDETVTDMATSAARQALANLSTDQRYSGGVTAIDMVIVATSTPKSTMPSVSAQVAGRLGLGHPAAFDMNAACAGFCYALAAADAIIRCGSSRGALVIGSDKASDWLDWNDRDTALLFGDGAGAAVVLPHDLPAVGPVLWGSVGEQFNLVGIDPRDRLLHQNGRAVYRWATGLAATLSEICDRNGTTRDELVAFVPHQANLRIVKALAKDFQSRDIVIATDVVDTGNTLAATIPIALSRMMDRCELVKGGKVLLFGFGAGLVYAGQVVTLPGRAR